MEVSVRPITVTEELRRQCRKNTAPSDAENFSMLDFCAIEFAAHIGRSNGAGPSLSAMSTIPVITVPASVKEFPDDVWSSLRAPSNVPVMTVLEPSNAVLAALQILSARNPRLYAHVGEQIENRTINTIQI